MRFIYLYITIFIILLSSCKAYKQDIMFKLDENFTEEDLTSVVENIKGNYILKANDRFNIDVFTNNGERLIDPNFELQMGQGQAIQQQNNIRDRFQYTIMSDGYVIFPLIGKFKLEGLTMFEAEQILAPQFNSIYKDSFIKIRMNNRRVILLGAPGGKVLPLPDENTNLVEILAAGGGIDFGAKSQNVKVIRGDLVFQIDLSTISGYQQSQMNVEPGDIIYVEPWRQVWLESLRDISPALSLFSSALTLIVIIQNLSTDNNGQ